MSVNVYNESYNSHLYNQIQNNAFSGKEKEWISIAIEQIKQEKNDNTIEVNISNHLKELNSFDPESIIRLVDVLQQFLREENKNKIFHFIQKRIVSLAIEKTHELIKPLLRDSKHYDIVVDIVIELAKHGQDPLALISKYKIPFHLETSEGKNAIVAIAQAAFIKKTKLICLNADNLAKLGLKVSSRLGQSILIELAKLSAQQDGRQTSKMIHTFSIDRSSAEGQRGLIEIAKLAALRHPGYISEFIRNYGIEYFQDGHRALIEIAKLVAQRAGRAISQDIQNYGFDPLSLEGQKALIEIAKLAAQDDGWGISDNIQEYSIDASTLEGQAALIEIAKLAAQNYGMGTSESIKKYGIDKFPNGQEALIEIAKLSAGNHGRGTSLHIRKYGIDASTSEGQKALIEIAKLAAQHDGLGTSQYIQKYGIDKFPDGQKALIEIAKLAAKQNGRGTSDFIRKYGIDVSTTEGQRVLIEIAMIAAQQDAWGTCKFFKEYCFDPSNPQTNLEYIKLLHFIYSQLIVQLKEFSVIRCKETFSFFTANVYCDLIKSTYASELDFFDGPNDALGLGDLMRASEELFESCQKKFEIPKKDLEWFQNALVKKSDDPFIQKRLLDWFITTACLCSTRKDLREAFKTQQGIIREISKQHPKLREDLVKAFIHLHYLENTQIWETLKATAGDTSYVQLSALLLASFSPEGESTYKEVIEKIKSERQYKEGKNQKLLLETLLKIRDCSLESAEKKAILENLFTKIPANKRLQALRLISDLIAFNGETYLKEVKEFSSLSKALGELFQHKFGVDVDDFSELYDKSIGTWRNKEALFTYGGNINDLPPHDKEQAKLYFQKLVTLILQSSFQRDRYTVDNNPHMADIQQNHPDVFEKWQIGESLNDTEIELEGKAKEIPIADRIITTLKQALEQNHLGDQQAANYSYLTACIGNWDQMDRSLPNLNKALEPLLGHRLSESELVARQTLLLQKKILELLQDTQDLEKKLIDLKSLIPNKVQFSHDIEDSIKLLQNSSEVSAACHVIDSDHPNHFLMMGTEVLNSCQNVNGTPSLNVCLLGYFLDGKHRLSLVCDEHGKILARSVLRLLIDSEGKPVLFQEKIYEADAAPKYPQLLRKLALKKAANLGIPLVVSPNDFEKEQAVAYPYKIHAKDKPIPFEYVDADNLRIQSGSYVINNALLVYTT